MKLLEIIFLTILCGVIVLIGNMIGYDNVTLYDSLLGIFVIVIIGVISYSISQLPFFNKLPSIVWISAIAIFLSSDAFPYSRFVIETTSKINFLAICTAVLAYAGLSIGKDIVAFKKISWRIIPVALAVISGTFLCATFIAQWALHLEGAI